MWLLKKNVRVTVGPGESSLQNYNVCGAHKQGCGAARQFESGSDESGANKGTENSKHDSVPGCK